MCDHMSRTFASTKARKQVYYGLLAENTYNDWLAILEAADEPLSEMTKMMAATVVTADPNATFSRSRGSSD